MVVYLDLAHILALSIFGLEVAGFVISVDGLWVEVVVVRDDDPVKVGFNLFVHNGLSVVERILKTNFFLVAEVDAS